MWGNYMEFIEDCRDNINSNFDYPNLNSNFELSFISLDSGGYIAGNNNLFKEIPHDDLFKLILKEAVKGTSIIKIGSGNPKVMIVSGIHGNELPPQLASLNLIKELSNKIINGTIYIVPFAAPKSTMENKRSFKGMDLNRSTHKRGSLSNLILKKIQELGVIALADFHSTSISSNPGREGVFCSLNPCKSSQLIGEYISKKTNSKLLWYEIAGSSYSGALEDECNLIGIPAITCEVVSPFGYILKNSPKHSLAQMKSFLSYFKII